MVRDKDKKHELIQYHEQAVFLEQAPLGIVVCGDVTKSWAFWRDDCAAAIMNMIMAGEAMGLSSCWCGLYPRDKRVDGFSKVLGLPGHIMPHSLLSIGYGAAPKKRREKIYEDRVHRNSSCGIIKKMPFV